jgi:ribosome-binding ATPase
VRAACHPESPHPGTANGARTADGGGADPERRGIAGRPVPLTLVALTIAIVGLPNVGKSTLFNALTKNSVLAANYPFATIEPNVGVVNLPDARLAKLAEIFTSERILPAPVSFVDIAGIVKGASEGEGLGNKFLANIREADAIAQVVRAFEDSDVIHVDGKVDAASDMETINTELVLADLQTIEKAQARYDRDLRAKKIDQATIDTASAAAEWLDTGNPLSASNIDIEPIRELGLLTAKPFIYVFNVDEAVLGDQAKLDELAALVAPAKAIFLDAKLESELIDLDEADAAELLASTGQEESGLDQLARIGFDTLGLQTYLTAGPKETRAWTIPRGAKAPQAAGVIHTDFEKGFIKAEIIGFDDLVETGSIAEARSKGKARIEGKDYVMQDGDVVEFRHS